MKNETSQGSTNYYYTFYSTFGINSRIGAKDTFEMQLDNNVDEIYFYTGKKDYKKVLEKNEQGAWIMAISKMMLINIFQGLKKLIFLN